LDKLILEHQIVKPNGRKFPDWDKIGESPLLNRTGAQCKIRHGNRNYKITGALNGGNLELNSFTFTS
jgi:hypothetical protein